MQKLCMAGDMTALKEAGFHEYESEMGGGFICIVTQPPGKFHASWTSALRFWIF